MCLRIEIVMEWVHMSPKSTKKVSGKSLLAVLSTSCGEICQSLSCLCPVSHHMTKTLRSPRTSNHPTSTVVTHCSRFHHWKSPNCDTTILAIVDEFSKACHVIPLLQAPYNHGDRILVFRGGVQFTTHVLQTFCTQLNVSLLSWFYD